MSRDFSQPIRSGSETDRQTERRAMRLYDSLGRSLDLENSVAAAYLLSEFFSHLFPRSYEEIGPAASVNL